MPQALRLPPTWRPGPIACRSMLQRRPDVAERCVRELFVDDDAAAPCLRKAAVAGDLLRRHWPERPSWQAAPPAVADDCEPGDWPHGWQLLASRALNFHFRETELLPQMRPSDRPCMRGLGWRTCTSPYFFLRTFFRQAAVKQGETHDRSLRARRPTGVRQDIALQRRAGVRVANVGGELAETLPALLLRASAPTGACTRLRQPCAAPRGWRELGPARCGGGRPQSPRPISLQLRGPAPSGDTARRAETPGRLPDACARLRFARRGRARGRREIGGSRHAEAG